MTGEPIYADPYTRIQWWEKQCDELEAQVDALREQVEAARAGISEAHDGACGCEDIGNPSMCVMADEVALPLRAALARLDPQETEWTVHLSCGHTADYTDGAPLANAYCRKCHKFCAITRRFKDGRETC